MANKSPIEMPNSSTSTASAKPATPKGKAIVTAGHSPTRDPGAVGNGHREADLMADLRNRIARHLHGKCEVWQDDDNHTLIQVVRALEQTITEHDVMVDLHLNAAGTPTATGTEVLVRNAVFADPKAPSRIAAAELSAAIATTLGIRNRGVKPESHSPHGRLAILNVVGQGGKLPKRRVLVEAAFITNAGDMQAYFANLDALAATIADWTLTQLNA